MMLIKMEAGAKVTFMDGEEIEGECEVYQDGRGEIKVVRPVGDEREE